MVQKSWRIIPTPLLETILNNHAQHHIVPQPLILHGPRGVGKTTLILECLLDKWNTVPHVTGYVDFAESVKNHHPKYGCSLRGRIARRRRRFVSSVFSLRIASSPWLKRPKLVINNIDVLKNAVLTDDTTVSASMYHDSLIWRTIALCVNERCLPVILVTSDSYYSYRAFIDFGFPDIFVSRETFGWTQAEAKMHMVNDYFSESEDHG